MYSSLSSLMVPSRSRMTSFMSDSFRQKGDVGDAVHGVAQVLEKRQPVAPQRCLVGHHLDRVEERVHRRLQHREGLEVARIVAALKESIRSPRRLLQRLIQTPLGGLLEPLQ